MKREYLKDVFTLLKEIDYTDGQITRFYKWCYDNKFFDNVTEEDVVNAEENCKNYNGIYLPTLKNHKICIKGCDYSWQLHKKYLIGIDPISCYDKPSKSSIVIIFPISKREEKRLYDLLNTLIDKKNSTSKDWFENARFYFYGKYRTFGSMPL